MDYDFDYLIIGAGPAGLQLGHYLEQNQRDYLILEREASPGAFFETFPRHRKLISINKVYTGKDDPEANLRWDWNSLLSEDDDLLFKNYTKRYFPQADNLVHYLADFARHFDIQIKYETEVVNVRKEGNRFILVDGNDNVYTGKRLIVATGIFKPYIPDIPGVELCENYIDHSVDPQDYINQRVLVVGKGNSAFETADNLTETAAAIHVCSPDSVRFAWQTHYVGHLRAVNNNFLDTYQLKSQNTVIDATITKIEKKGERYLVHMAYTHANGQTAVVPYDRVIFCTGFRFDDSIFDESCRPELTIRDKFPAQTSEWESVNVPDLYFAGTLMQACDYRKTMSGFIHGFRHNVASLSHLFEAKYHGVAWPSQEVEATPEAVLQQVIKCVNRSSGIFLQPGFLADVVIVDEAQGVARHYHDVRRDHIHQSDFGRHEHYYTITLEYGRFQGDPFSVERDPDPEKAHEAAYLHPVIRRFRCHEQVAEHHIHDDLESEWHKEIYVQPAREFFQAQIATNLSPVAM